MKKRRGEEVRDGVVRIDLEVRAANTESVDVRDMMLAADGWRFKGRWAAG